jgi:hypothetical protein
MSKVRLLLKNMTKSFFVMPLKCHYHLHPLVEFEKGIVNQGVEEDNSFNICKMTIGMDLINRELLLFRCYQVHVKNIKCPFQW